MKQFAYCIPSVPCRDYIIAKAKMNSIPTSTFASCTSCLHSTQPKHNATTTPSHEPPFVSPPLYSPICIPPKASPRLPPFHRLRHQTHLPHHLPPPPCPPPPSTTLPTPSPPKTLQHHPSPPLTKTLHLRRSPLHLSSNPSPKRIIIGSYNSPFPYPPSPSPSTPLLHYTSNLHPTIHPSPS